MPPAGYPAFLQYLQSGRVSLYETPIQGGGQGVNAWMVLLGESGYVGIKGVPLDDLGYTVRLGGTLSIKERRLGTGSQRVKKLGHQCLLAEVS